MLKPQKNIIFIEQPDEDLLPRVKVKFIPEHTECEVKAGDTVLIRDGAFESLAGIHFIVNLRDVVAIATGEDALA